MSDDKDAEIARLRREVDRLHRMRDEDEAYVSRRITAERMRIDHLQRELASARSSHELQTKATLAFRDDYLRERARADALEPSA